jgi:hypothetical protein
MARAEVVFEAVGFSYPAARWLERPGYTIHIAHVRRVPRSGVKTGKKDAFRLLTPWRGNAMPEAYLLPEEVRRVRDLAQQRHFLGPESRSAQGRLRQDLRRQDHVVGENPVETAASGSVRTARSLNGTSASSRGEDTPRRSHRPRNIRDTVVGSTRARRELFRVNL